MFGRERGPKEPKPSRAERYRDDVFQTEPVSETEQLTQLLSTLRAIEANAADLLGRPRAFGEAIAVDRVNKTGMHIRQLLGYRTEHRPEGEVMGMPMLQTQFVNAPDLGKDEVILTGYAACEQRVYDATGTLISIPKRTSKALAEMVERTGALLETLQGPTKDYFIEYVPLSRLDHPTV